MPSEHKNKSLNISIFGIAFKKEKKKVGLNDLPVLLHLLCYGPIIEKLKCSMKPNAVYPKSIEK